MPKRRQPVCPFYREQCPHQIRCEGLVARGADQVFENAERKREWYRDYCSNFGYRICPYYRAVMKERYKE